MKEYGRVYVAPHLPPIYICIPLNCLQLTRWQTLITGMHPQLEGLLLYSFQSSPVCPSSSLEAFNIWLTKFESFLIILVLFEPFLSFIHLFFTRFRRPRKFLDTFFYYRVFNCRNFKLCFSSWVRLYGFSVWHLARLSACHILSVAT